MHFRDWLYAQEGLLLPDKPRWVGMTRINPFPGTNADRRRWMPKKVKPPKPFAPTVIAVNGPLRPIPKPKFVKLPSFPALTTPR